MHESIEHQAPKVPVDEYGNFHQITDELARGGQGVVYRTKDADLAVKQPLDASGQPDSQAATRNGTPGREDASPNASSDSPTAHKTA